MEAQPRCGPDGDPKPIAFAWRLCHVPIAKQRLPAMRHACCCSLYKLSSQLQHLRRRATLVAQVVTDEQWAARAERFPDQPPKTKEYYLLRAIFQKHFPSESAYETVPLVRLLSTVSLSVIVEPLCAVCNR